MTPWLLAAPFGLQAAALLCDEFYFHRRRGLPAWERIGHPVDTAAMLACLGFLLAVPPSYNAAKAYLALAALASLCVTKDELVHSRACSPAEHWLHALLFLLHPCTLGAAFALWPSLHGGGLGQGWLPAAARGVRTAYVGLMALIGAFGAYQAVYWNLWRKEPV